MSCRYSSLSIVRPRNDVMWIQLIQLPASFPFILTSTVFPSSRQAVLFTAMCVVITFQYAAVTKRDPMDSGGDGHWSPPPPFFMQL